MRRLSWALLIAGGAILVGRIIYGLLTALGRLPVLRWELIAGVLVLLGIAGLLASIIAERLRESRQDPYREVKH